MLWPNVANVGKKPTSTQPDGRGGRIDLGPTWFWPDTQPSITKTANDYAERLREDEEAENEAEDDVRRLGPLDEAAPVEAIREDARPRGQDEEREELEGGDDADLRARVLGENREDEPVLGDALHPRAGRGDDVREEPHAEVVDSQGLEGS